LGGIGFSGFQAQKQTRKGGNHNLLTAATWPSSGEVHDWTAQRWQTDWLRTDSRHRHTQLLPRDSPLGGTTMCQLSIYIHDMGPRLGRITEPMLCCQRHFTALINIMVANLQGASKS